jgi:catechol 2,3-dioxygenase-like lactoylglutathione lyase family enzyme
VKLDHIAIATHTVDHAFETLIGELGASIMHGGESVGFRALQVRMGKGGMSIELLEPWNVEHNDFLVRFLERSGPGPHHITFKTDDLRALLERAEAAGYHPVGVNLANPWWMEAFLHPKEAGGTVVQLAQSDFEPDDIAGFDTALTGYGWWPDPPPRAEAGATLQTIVIATKALPDSLRLYRDLLGGHVAREDEGVAGLTWDGGCIRLEQNDHEPGVVRLEAVHDGPETERTIEGARFVLRPRD